MAHTHENAGTPLIHQNAAASSSAAPHTPPAGYVMYTQPAQVPPPTLSLSVRNTANIKRTRFAIDGTDYHFSAQEDLSLRDQIRLAKLSETFQLLDGEWGGSGGIAGLSDDDINAVADALREATRIVTHDVPAELLDALTDAHCLALVQGFGEAQQVPAASL